MESPFTIRSAQPEDTAAMLEIYRPFIETNSASFELAVPSLDEFGQRVTTSQRAHGWLVAVADGQPIGYAYGGVHRARAAYQWTAEVSAYIDGAWHRRGVASQLYTSLLDQLRDRGYCTALAGVTLPNDGSVGFHQRMGFRPIGTFHSIGFKFGQWHDVAWFEKALRNEPHPAPPQ